MLPPAEAPRRGPPGPPSRRETNRRCNQHSSAEKREGRPDKRSISLGVSAALKVVKHLSPSRGEPFKPINGTIFNASLPSLSIQMVPNGRAKE